MRTRTGPASASVAALAAASASDARENATKNASPCVSTSTPLCCANASRNTRRCSASASAYASPSSCSSRVEPSMSVNRKVTVPEGSSATGVHHPQVHCLVERQVPARFQCLVEPRPRVHQNEGLGALALEVPAGNGRALHLRLDRAPETARARDVAEFGGRTGDERETVDEADPVAHLAGQLERPARTVLSVGRPAEVEVRERHGEEHVLLPPCKPGLARKSESLAVQLERAFVPNGFALEVSKEVLDSRHAL